MGKKILIIAGFALLGLIAFGLLIQLVPYGKDYTNPPVVAEPAWDSQQTRALTKRACFDCHSNETVWPWYSRIAPVSWLVRRDVDEGRHHLNFSEWGIAQVNGERHEVDELAEVVQEGKMPLPIYLLMHPEAALTNAEKQELINGLEKLQQ